MMKFEILTFLFVYHTAVGIQWSFLKPKNNLNAKDVDLNCKKFKCEPVVEPVCAKIKYTAPELANTTLKIIVINKCEMGYVKCHKGMKAIAVSMENCRRHDRRKRQDQSGSSCPENCPVRDVMVCARSRSGLHETFLSVCHMRMYHCQYPDEELQLISRQPCVLTAPYLPQKAAPESETPEHVDDDRILRFIYCRWHHPLMQLNHRPAAKSITVDPRCVDFRQNELGTDKVEAVKGDSLLDLY